MSDIDDKSPRNELVRLTASIVSAYLSRNPLGSSHIQDVINTVYSSLSNTGTAPTEQNVQASRPSVPVKKSIMPDYIICLEDGKKLKMLKRHLRTTYNLTPDEYRTKWGLPSDYPMVAPNYAIQRSEFAKKIGLGRKVVTETKPPVRRARK